MRRSSRKQALTPPVLRTMLFCCLSCSSIKRAEKRPQCRHLIRLNRGEASPEQPSPNFVRVLQCSAVSKAWRGDTIESIDPERDSGIVELLLHCIDLREVPKRGFAD